MTKISPHLLEQKEMSLEIIKRFLAKNYLAYVLIVCSNPSQQGAMEVEMSCEGEDCLTDYLLESARQKKGLSNEDSNSSESF